MTVCGSKEVDVKVAGALMEYVVALSERLAAESLMRSLDGYDS